MTTREDLVYRAKLAEQAERYDEMKDVMREIAESEIELTVEERNLLSVAYKNAVGARRASWRIISSVETRKRAKNQDDQAQLASNYRKRVEVELREICNNILSLLSKTLVPAAVTAEAKVFFHKMMGDYHRYVAEFVDGDSKQIAIDSAKDAYNEATTLATEQLEPTHPIRLGLALNFSVFFYEILNNSKVACSMAKKAFDDAISKLDGVSEDSYRDSTLIMHLLRDNLTLWNPSDVPEGTNEAAVPAEGLVTANA